MSGVERGDSGFLSRWSERKLQTRRGREPPEPAGISPAAEQDHAVSESHTEEVEPLLTDADMPALEYLGAHSDYSGFLSKGVSEALRRKALSQLFRSAHLNLVDGLDDYAEDFTKFTPLGDVITADMRYRVEQAAERLLDGQDPMETSARRTAEIEAEPPQVPTNEIPADPDEDPTEGEEV